MAEKINLKLTADSLSVTGLTIQNGRLELALTAEVDLDSLECSLRRQLLDLAEATAPTPAAAPAPQPPATQSANHKPDCVTADRSGDHAPDLPRPLPELSLQALLNATEPAVALPQEELAEDGLPIPDPVPQEHFFPEPDDENLLAEEALAGYTEEEFFPEPKAAGATEAEPVVAVTGVLFEAELPPAHYFPEPGEELIPVLDPTGDSAITTGSTTGNPAVWTEDNSCVDTEDVDDDNNEVPAMRSPDEVDLGWDEELDADATLPDEAPGNAGLPTEQPAPATFLPTYSANESQPVPDSDHAANDEFFDDEPDAGDSLDSEDDEKHAEEMTSAETDTGHVDDSGDDAIDDDDADETMEEEPAAEGLKQRFAPSLEDGLGAPASRYGEPEADIEWSALLGDRHSEAASLTRPVDTAVEPHQTFPAAPEQPEAQNNPADEPDAASSLPADADTFERGTPCAEPSEQQAPDDNAPAAAAAAAQAPTNAPADLPAAQGGKKRMPFELINPKLHNAGDAPDDTPPGSEATGTHNADHLPQERAGASLRGKSKIKYVCPKCHTPGQQEMDRLGSVVTCANCGRAMRLTMRR